MLRLLTEDERDHLKASLTGHKTRSVFDRCDIVSEGDMRDAATKLDATAAARQS